MTYLRDLMMESEAAVRSGLFGGEEVLASGRCADISTTGDLDSAGAAWTFVMVTDRRVHWVPNISRLAGTCSLDLDEVWCCAELHWRNRSAMSMFHEPLIRQYFTPNGRQQNWMYLSDLVVGSLSRTILGFSRPAAAASERLKEQLALRGVEARPAELPDRLP